eukprot:GFUD01042743.1.p1 GENE.GFUD01042743.1~~GFUD01042743.1.p1  ORF type:complete len:530 (+),score=144.61 GFUD01042743.1:65-1591(+)
MEQLYSKSVDGGGEDVVTFILPDISLYSVHDQPAGVPSHQPTLDPGQYHQYPDSVDRANLVCRELSSSGDSYSAADVLVYTGKGQGKTVKFHRWLLSAVSPFLSRLLYSADPYQSRDRLELYLPDFSWKVVSCLATFLYQGQVKVRQRTSSHIKQLLRLLQVDMVLDIERVRDKDTDFEANMSTEIMDINEEEEDGEETLRKTHTTSVVIGMKQSFLSRKKKCEKCNKAFATNFSLRKHTRLVHMEVSDFNCEYCKKAFSCNETLKNHTRTHTGEMLSCYYDNCAKAFLNPRDLKDHENVHTKETSYLCPDCGDVFDTNKKMLNHREKHKKNDKPCNICGKLIKNFASFKAHIRAHGLERAHSCNICGKSFKRNFDLTVHMRIHTGAKPYTCDICDKSFSLSSTLSKHKKYHQSSGVTFPCNLCEMIFPGSKELSEHGRDMHREFLVVEENGQLIMREETNQIMISKDNLNQILPPNEGTVESIIIEPKENSVDGGLVQFHVSRMSDL